MKKVRNVSDTKPKKHSIASAVTFRVALTLLLAMSILLVGIYFFVYRIIYDQTLTYSQTIVTIYAELIFSESVNMRTPIDPEHSESATSYGQSVCDWYNADYAYVYRPNVDKGTVTGIALARGIDHLDEPNGHYVPGVEFEYTLLPEEAAVWEEKVAIANLASTNIYGQEIGAITKIYDVFGNPVLVGVDMSYEDVFAKVIRLFLVIAAIIFVIILGVLAVIYLIVRKKVLEPAKTLCDSMNGFVTNGQLSHVQLPENGPHEYAMIASSFHRMTENIDSYLSDIRALTQEQEQKNTELSIAAKIQKGFLPAESFSFPTCDCHALMSPAKDVGGDLYDYRSLGDGKILVVIADVSGKGISASLFMSVTLILIRQNAKMNMTPSEILQKTNDALAANNAAMLFATAFVGIYDSKTQTLSYANAGHNLPYLLSGGKVSALSGEAGTVLGFFEDEIYPEYSVSLQPEDTLFLYTDGVTEATDEQNRFYGEEELEKELARYLSCKDENLIDFLSDSLRSFAGNAEQHDDITMLTLTVKNHSRFTLPAEVSAFHQVKQAILSLPLSHERQLNLCLAAEEYFVNICSYAYEGKQDAEKTVTVSIGVTENQIELSFEDSGIPFDPTKDFKPAEDYDIDTMLGGLGTFIASSIVDKTEYEYTDGKNRLKLIVLIKEN